MSNESIHNNGEDNSSKRKKTVKRLLLFIIVFLILFSGVNLLFSLYNRYMIQNPSDTTEATVAPVSQSSDSKVQNPIDFASLQAKNSDIYAYIKVDGTNVDHPIVQNPTDDNFYLKHSAEDKSWSASGAVYTELVNTKSFRDPVTVIYGHNGYGDTFFTTLHRFEDTEFFNSHPYFYIYTPDRKLTYQIISAFKYDDRHIMNSFRFTDTNELTDFQQFLLKPDSALKNTRQTLEPELNKDSRIVILSTCITNQKSSRYLVCGVLINDEKTY